MRAILIGLLFFAGACQTVGQSALVHPAPPVAEMAGDKELFLSFMQKSFFIDGETRRGADVSLFRRVRPVLVSFRGQQDSAFKAEALKTLNNLQRITGVPFKVSDYKGPIGNGDLFIYLEDAKKIENLSYSRMGTKSKCIMRWYADGRRSRGLLNMGEVWISTEPKSDWAYCLNEEISQVYGVTGDGRLGAPSAFSDYLYNGQTKYPDVYTDWDSAALWIAYHQDLRPGMMWDEAEPIVRRIVAETWPNF